MKLKQAKSLADQILRDLAPFCERAEIAGSIRREKPEVKDVEIVVVPRFGKQFDLFGYPLPPVSLLESRLNSLLLKWEAYPVKNGAKYKQISINPFFVKLDLFIVTGETWGVQFALRTGPAEYSQWLVTQKRFGGALPSFAKVEGGRVLVHGKPIDTPEEKDFFDFLEIPMPAPPMRRLSK